MAFHRTAVLKRTYPAEHVPKLAKSNPGTGGPHIDPDRRAYDERNNDDKPIHVVGKHSDVKRKRIPSPELHSPSKRKHDHHSSNESSACRPGVGGHFPDPHLAVTTDEAFIYDTELFGEIAEAFGFRNFKINSSGEPLPCADMTVPSQLSNVSHVGVEPNGPHLHSNHT